MNMEIGSSIHIKEEDILIDNGNHELFQDFDFSL